MNFVFNRLPLSETIRPKLDEFQSGNKILIYDDSGKEWSVDKIPNLQVEFLGKNAILKLHQNVKIRKMGIRMGERAYFHIGKESRIRFSLYADLSNRNATLFIGDRCDIGTIKFFIEREPNLEVIIGDDFMAANDIEFRTSDAHAIYTLENPRKTINKPKFGIHIGDHVWIGERVIVAKDAEIASNSVVGACSFVGNKSFPENVIIAGVPGKVIKEGINWDSKSTYNYEKMFSD